MLAGVTGSTHLNSMPLDIDRRQSNIDRTRGLRISIDNIEYTGHTVASRDFNTIINMYRHILNIREIEVLLIDNNEISYCNYEDHTKITGRPDTGKNVKLCLECRRIDLRSCVISLGSDRLMMQDKYLINTGVTQNSCYNLPQDIQDTMNNLIQSLDLSRIVGCSWTKGHEGAPKLQVIRYGASNTAPDVTMLGQSRSLIIHLRRNLSNLLITVLSNEPTCAYVNDTVE